MATIPLETPKRNEADSNDPLGDRGRDKAKARASTQDGQVAKKSWRNRLFRTANGDGVVASDQRIKVAVPSTRLTREGYQFVFMLMFVWLAAILQNVNLLVLLAGAFCCMLLIQWRVTSATLWGLQAKRYVPSGIEARKPFIVVITVFNPRVWLGSWLLMIHENFAIQANTRGLWQPGQGLTLFMERLLPGGSEETSYQCVAPRRGKYRFQQMELSTRFPLTLMRGRVASGEAQTVFVRPTIGKLSSNWRKALGLPQLGQTRRAAAVSGGDGEFYGLRAYRAGDTPRWIHWRTSAKRNELLVRQFERDEKQSLVAILDLSLDSKVTLDPDTIDKAIEVFATLISQIVLRDKSHATVSVLDQSPGVTYQLKTAKQLHQVLDRLAVAVSPKSDRLLETLQLLSQRNSSKEPILVVSLRNRPSWLHSADGPQSQNGAVVEESKTIPAVLPVSPSFYSSVRWLNINDSTWENLFQRG